MKHSIRRRFNELQRTIVLYIRANKVHRSTAESEEHGTETVKEIKKNTHNLHSDYEKVITK